MFRRLFSLLLVTTTITSHVALAALDKTSHQYLAEKAELKADVAVFIAAAKEELPVLKAKLEQSQNKEIDQAWVNAYEVIILVADKDIVALNEKSSAELTFPAGICLIAAGDKFAVTQVPAGVIVERWLGGGNALAFALGLGLLDETAEDAARTTELIKLLCDKQLDPNVFAGIVYWVKDPAGQTSFARDVVRDYVARFSLAQVAEFCCSPEAETLFLQYQEAHQGCGCNE